MEKHYLNPLFAPDSIIVFAGALAGGGAVAAQMRAGGFAGPLTFLDVGQRGTLAELARARADLAVIALPNAELAAALDLAGRLQCRAALIVSAGVDAALAAALHTIARKHGMALLGPNCLGYQRPGAGLNAGAAGPLARPGSLALVTQSGALTASILDWAASNGVGFSAVVSLGPNSAVELSQTLDFLASDSATHSIAVCMEGIVDARRFTSALRAAANSKPVVVLKSGRHGASSQAALTHSGAIVGSDEVFGAALRRAGAVRVDSFVELFAAAKCLALRHRPVGKRLAVISNGGGPGVLAADRIAALGLELARLAPAAALELALRLDPLAVLEPLIDLGPAAGAAQYRAALAACALDPGIDGVLAIYSPHLDGAPSEVAAVLVVQAATMAKPLLACWMGDQSVAPARQLLHGAGIASFRTPEAAVDAFGHIAAFYHNQQLLRQTPPPLSNLPKPDLEGARMLVESVLAERRCVLTEIESKALLAAFHIPITQTVLARSATEAILVASQLGYPVALKIDSPDIAHKSDVGGVVLNVPNATSVRELYGTLLADVARLAPQASINGVTIQKMSDKKRGRELYIGVVTDQRFGPVISFGAGGSMIELMNECAVELPPLNQFLAQQLIGRVHLAGMLGPWRGAPAVEREAIEHILLRVSEMVCALPQLRQMDINPLIVDDTGALVVDARFVIGQAPTSLPDYGHLAILPYPSRYTEHWPLRGNGQCLVRPIRPDDADMLQAFTRALSDESRYMRFVSAMSELPATMLARFTLIDYDREMALVAVCSGDDDGPERIVGVARYVRNPDLASCEFALVVADAFGGRGLGSRLMLSIIEVARDKGLSEIVGLVLNRNSGMLKLMRSLGFTVISDPEDADFKRCSMAL